MRLCIAITPTILVRAYDIHSPCIPAQAEMEALLLRALKVLRPEQIWVNPDCGLKTRRWSEAIPALQAMVAAAQRLREHYGS